MSWIHICWSSFLSVSLAVKFPTFWDQYSTVQKYLINGSKVSAVFSWNQGKLKSRGFLSYHYPSLRLWLANTTNKTTLSNQRGANSITAASLHTKNQLCILGASNTGFVDIIWGLALRVLHGLQDEITTLKGRMVNKDPSCVNAKCDWIMLT